jgi:hypothetical protein
MKNNLMPLALFILLSSCSTHKKNHEKGNDTRLAEFEWLLGSWSDITNDSRFYEIWARTNDSVFSATSFLMADNDTVFSETATLRAVGDAYYYIPIVQGQNQNSPVEFKLVSADNGRFIFENQEHDFPQRIIYSNPSADSLRARIEGNENGKFRTEDFAFSRSR